MDARRPNGVPNGAAHSLENDPSAATTVLVAVQAPQVREALTAMINSLDGFRVVGETASDDETVEMARSLCPRLALVDQDLAPGGGTWAMRRLMSEHLVEAVVAIGLRGDDGTRSLVRAAGAQAYVQTGAPPSDLLTALQSALVTVPVDGHATNGQDYRGRGTS